MVILFSYTDFGLFGEFLLRFAFISLFLGLPSSVAATVWAFRNAPEGYEDEDGFHFSKGRSPLWWLSVNRCSIYSSVLYLAGSITPIW
jgi:hypothetical protein